MNRGSGLLEVMITLLVIMLFFTAAARTSVFATRAGGYAQAHTRASVLSHEKLLELQGAGSESTELKIGWHRDPGNPIEVGQDRFFRYWQVGDASQGRDVTLLVAWNDGTRKVPDGGFGSLETLQESGCPRVSFHDVIP